MKPALLLMFKRGRSVAGAVVAGMLAVAAMWIERSITILPTLNNPRLPWPHAIYRPTWVEAAVTALLRTQGGNVRSSLLRGLTGSTTASVVHCTVRAIQSSMAGYSISATMHQYREIADHDAGIGFDAAFDPVVIDDCQSTTLGSQKLQVR